MEYVGIDVSKDDFYADMGDGEAVRFANDDAGVAAFLGRLAERGLAPSSTTIGMEATGVYHFLVADRASAAGWGVRVINPLLVSRLGKATLRHAKTDPKDATLVRAATMQGLGHAPPGRETMRLRALVQERASLVAMRAKLRQLQHVRAVRGASLDDPGEDRYAPVETALSAQVSALDRAARRVDAATQKLLRSIPGIGPACAAALAAKVGDARNFPSPEKLVAFVGLDCRVHESGTSVRGKGFIVKRGDGMLRHLLFLAANVSRRHVPELGAYYAKKKGEGKHHYSALCAVERKLVHLVWAVWTRGTPYARR